MVEIRSQKYIYISIHHINHQFQFNFINKNVPKLVNKYILLELQDYFRVNHKIWQPLLKEIFINFIKLATMNEKITNT